MIAIQKIGRNFVGALGYNMKKVLEGDYNKRAEILETNFSSLDVKHIVSEVNLIRELRPSLNRYVYHTSLNFPISDNGRLDNEKMLAIAHDYMAAMGLSNNQYMLFRHHDAEHPHLHILANRITFDGDVVSDSNNYKRSEEILRGLEEKYNLIAVKPSNKAALRAPKKDEVEMAVRTGKPSGKMALQAILKTLLERKGIYLSDLIRLGEQQGIYFLFNQASTGRVSGITYFYQGFKIKGQALGNRFKWAELIKYINYEQIRDSATISAANERTKGIYGDTGAPDQTTTAGERYGSTGLPKNLAQYPLDVSQPGGRDTQAKAEDSTGGKGSLEADQVTCSDDTGSTTDRSDSAGSFSGIQIADDIDDEAMLGRNRHRQKKARTNRR